MRDNGSMPTVPAPTSVVVLNGASSTGKTAIARSLQGMLDEPWLVLGVDTLLTAWPVQFDLARGGAGVDPERGVRVGPAYRAVERAWLAGVAQIARGGARIILDEVFLDGAADQRRREDALGGLGVLWVAVRCEPAVTASRESDRGDRPIGQAALQASVVHRGVAYDIEVDTTTSSPGELAVLIAAHIVR